MIELGNIIYKYEKVVRFYLVGFDSYMREFGSHFDVNTDKDKNNLYIKVVSGEGACVDWIGMKKKFFKKSQVENDYKIYFETLVNEYGYSLNEYPQSYVDKILEKDEFIRLTKLFYERSWQNVKALL